MSTKINLISDTVTKPTPEMKRAMMEAEVGDDVFGEDPSVNTLQAYAAKMFGKEAALFCPSGTMTNQLAIHLHTRPLDEIICDHYSHVYQYETGGPAFHSRVSMNLIEGTNGKITDEQIEAVIRPDYDWLPTSRLVVLENTCNKGGGSYYTIEEIEPIAELCRREALKLHLDGARLFNALVETGEKPADMAALFDSVSICLSKGLGAPVGSLLLGDRDFIKRARKVRKAFGGGMRQAGYLAAAGLYALENHIDRLKIDNKNAKELGDLLNAQKWVENVRPVKTNIVIFDVKEPLTARKVLDRLEMGGIYASAFGLKTIRFVTHLDFTQEMLKRTMDEISRRRF